MSELVGVTSNLNLAHAQPLARISPSLREQQRTRVGSAKIERRPPPAAAGANAAPAPDKSLHPAIIGGILLPLGIGTKPRSQSATSKPKSIAPRAHSPYISVSRQKLNAAPPAPLHRRGIYTLARAGPSIMTAWEASASAAPVFTHALVTRRAADFRRHREQYAASERMRSDVANLRCKSWKQRA